jgi:hypothetical protein
VAVTHREALVQSIAAWAHQREHGTARDFAAAHNAMQQAITDLEIEAERRATARAESLAAHEHERGAGDEGSGMREGARCRVCRGTGRRAA